MVTTQTVTGGGQVTLTAGPDDENDGEQSDNSGEGDNQEDAAGKGLAFSGSLLAVGLVLGAMVSSGYWI